MREVVIPAGVVSRVWTDPAGRWVECPVRVNWFPGLTGDQCMMNSLARLDGRPEPYPDPNLFTVKLERPERFVGTGHDVIYVPEGTDSFQCPRCAELRARVATLEHQLRAGRLAEIDLMSALVGALGVSEELMSGAPAKETMLAAVARLRAAARE